MDVLSQADIDEKNVGFWNELCGTQLAQSLGISDMSNESLVIFDNYYRGYYPYLERYLNLSKLKGKNVLEVGLGYGTVSQMLALSGANYHGLDIAAKPTAMVKHRLTKLGLSGDVRVGSMLSCPYQDNYFDYVISIGCFHHTGDIQACVNQAHRVLNNGGVAIIMLYNKFSYRQWRQWPKITFLNFLNQMLSKENISVTQDQRAAYDSSSKGDGAPETVFSSIKDVNKIFKNFSNVTVRCENFDEGVNIKIGKIFKYNFPSRLKILNSVLCKFLGLDLYIVAEK